MRSIDCIPIYYLNKPSHPSQEKGGEPCGGSRAQVEKQQLLKSFSVKVSIQFQQILKDN